eukprot:scaffold317_cov95-Skeletonema_dohrnii-CCMP3373.AAC.2
MFRWTLAALYCTRKDQESCWKRFTPPMLCGYAGKYRSLVYKSAGRKAVFKNSPHFLPIRKAGICVTLGSV